MTWVRLDDGFFRHPKVVRAGRDARDLYLAALCYCQAGLTDGFVDALALRRLAADAEVDDAAALTERLVEVGLWERAAGGFLIHDYLDYNPTGEKVRKERTEAAERMKFARSSPEQCANNSRSSPSPLPLPDPRRKPLPTPSPAGGDEAPTALASAAFEKSEARKAVGDLLFGAPGFRESAAFWEELDGMAEWVALRPEVVKALDWLKSKKKRQITSRFILNWLQKASVRAKHERAEETASVSGDGDPPDEWFEPPPLPPFDPAAETLWTQASQELRLRMTPASYQTYFSEAHGIAFEGPRLVVGVPNPLLLDGLERFRPLMRDTLTELSGKPADVRLVAS